MSDKKPAEQVDQPKKWQYSVHADGQGAADFANTPPAQLAGEASFSLGADGQVHTFLFY